MLYSDLLQLGPKEDAHDSLASLRVCTASETLFASCRVVLREELVTVKAEPYRVMILVVT